MTEQTLMSAMNAPRVVSCSVWLATVGDCAGKLTGHVWNTQTGSTPLHVAAEKGHLVVVQVLIKEASADPNIQTHVSHSLVSWLPCSYRLSVVTNLWECNYLSGGMNGSERLYSAVLCGNR